MTTDDPVPHAYLVGTVAGAMLGRYEVIRHLASGGMADLLLARARGLEGFERHVVIKRIRADAEDDQAFIDMFLVEARLAGALHHHNIVQVHDVGEENGKPYFAMEYVHGEDLRKLLALVAQKGEQLPFAVVVTIVTAVARALHHAHEQRGTDQQPLGIVHRDVSPANIVVAYDGNVKVLDFGIARAALRRTETQAGMLKGKAPYMAPEQCTGAPVDRRSDVFGLGIVLYELVTARRLFKADSDFLTMSMVVNGAFPKPSTIRKELPPDLERIIMRALARDPGARYQTAEQMFTALEQLALTAEWRTSASSLAAYMTTMFGTRTEPWLEKETIVPAIPVDFDGARPGLATAPVEPGTSGVPSVIGSDGTMSAPAPVKIPEASAPVNAGKVPLKPVPVTPAPARVKPKTMQVPIAKSLDAKPPAAKVETKPGAKIEATPEAKVEAMFDATRGAKPLARSEAKTEVVPEATPGAKPDAQQGAKPTAKADGQPGATPLARSEATTEVQPIAKTAAKPQGKVEAKPAATVEATPEVQPIAKTAAKPQGKVEAKPVATVESTPEATLGAKPEAKIGALPAATLGVKPEAKIGAPPAATLGVKPDPRSEATVEARFQAMPDSRLAAKPQATIEPKPKPLSRITGKPAPTSPRAATTELTNPVVEPDDTHTEAMPLPPAISPHAARQLKPLPPPNVARTPAARPGAADRPAPSAPAAHASTSDDELEDAAAAPDLDGPTEISAAPEPQVVSPEPQVVSPKPQFIAPEPHVVSRRSDATAIVEPLPSPLFNAAPRARRMSELPVETSMTPVEDTDQQGASRRPRWMIPAIGGGLTVLVIVIIAIARSGGDVDLGGSPETATVAEPLPAASPAPAPAPADDVRTEARPRTWANSQSAESAESAEPAVAAEPAPSVATAEPGGEPSVPPEPAIESAPMPDPAPESASPSANPVTTETGTPRAREPDAARPAADPVTKPAADPVTEPAAKPAAESVTKPAAESVTKPAAESVTKPAVAVTKPAPKPAVAVTKPAAKPAVAVTKPAAKPAVAVTKPATKPAPKPAAVAKAKPAQKPAAVAKPTKPLPKPNWNPNSLFPNKK